MLPPWLVVLVLRLWMRMRFCFLFSFSPMSSDVSFSIAWSCRRNLVCNGKAFIYRTEKVAGYWKQNRHFNCLTFTINLLIIMNEVWLYTQWLTYNASCFTAPHRLVPCQSHKLISLFNNNKKLLKMIQVPSNLHLFITNLPLLNSMWSGTLCHHVPIRWLTSLYWFTFGHPQMKFWKLTLPMSFWCYQS